MAVRILRKKDMANQVVFVDGQAGCGKTLFSPIIASLSRVELLTYSYQIQNYCSMRHLDLISADSANTLIRYDTDLQIYNTMMGRELNFRPSDLSSVFNDHNPSRYFKRTWRNRRIIRTNLTHHLVDLVILPTLQHSIKTCCFNQRDLQCHH